MPSEASEHKNRSAREGRQWMNRMFPNRYERQALNLTHWRQFTDGAVTILVKFPQPCDGCGREIGAGCVACRVVENKSLDVNYLCHDCYDKFKAGKRRERMGYDYTKRS